MNKSLISLALLGVLVLSLGGVFAQGINIPQNSTFNILASLHMSILPEILSFGDVEYGISKLGPNVTFDSSDSNVVLTVTTAVSDADALFRNIDLMTATDAWTPIFNFNATFPIGGGIQTYPSRITIPDGTPAGSYSGQILYTVMGPQPV